MKYMLPLTLEANQLKHITFQEATNIERKRDLEKLQKDLYLGMLMGNNFKRKVRILFNANDEVHQVITTIWATTEKNIVLNGGSFIPISSIRSVELY